MAFIINKQSMSMRDARGHVGKMRFYYKLDNSLVGAFDNAAGAIDAAVTALAAASNAAIIDVTGINEFGLFSPLFRGTAAQFADVEDKARLVFLYGDSGPTAEFSLVRLEIPAPKLAIFYADQETVNSAVPLMVAITTALSTIDATGGRFTNRAGLVYVNFVGGYRIRRKLQRKLTLYDLSPNLDEPEE